MENATKALLIAAAVLIVILVIAFGMQIFKSAGSAGTDAQVVGNQISSQSNQAAIAANSIIQGITIPTV